MITSNFNQIGTFYFIFGRLKGGKQFRSTGVLGNIFDKCTTIEGVLGEIEAKGQTVASLLDCTQNYFCKRTDIKFKFFFSINFFFFGGNVLLVEG